jgi:hypothetical protein
MTPLSKVIIIKKERDMGYTKRNKKTCSRKHDEKERKRVGHMKVQEYT